jgi:hypothetical protein
MFWWLTEVPIELSMPLSQGIEIGIFENNLKLRTSTWLRKADLLFVVKEHQNSADDEVVVVEKPTAGTGIHFQSQAFWEASSCLDLSLFLSSNNTQTKNLLLCSLFMVEERQKPVTEEMVVQKYITEKDLPEAEKPGIVVEKVGKEEGDLSLDGREDLTLKLTFSLDDRLELILFFKHVAMIQPSILLI